MEAHIMEILLGFLSFLATTVIGLYINSVYKQNKEYRDFLERLNSIVGLGGRVIYKDDNVYRLFQVEKIDRQGMVLKANFKTIFVPISKLMKDEIIVPDINYENVMKELSEEDNAKEQEMDEFKHKRTSEIYAHTMKDIIKVHILPEIEKIVKGKTE